MGQERADKLLQNLELLKRKLDLFQIYPVKILRKISDDSYIVTLFGVELIAQSSISFKQKNGLVQVLGFSPSIHLKFINPTYSFDKAYYNFIKQYQIELAPYNQYIFHILSNTQQVFHKQNCLKVLLFYKKLLRILIQKAFYRWNLLSGM